MEAEVEADLKFPPYISSSMHADKLVRLKLRPLLFLSVGLVLQKAVLDPYFICWWWIREKSFFTLRIKAGILSSELESYCLPPPPPPTRLMWVWNPSSRRIKTWNAKYSESVTNADTALTNGENMWGVEKQKCVKVSMLLLNEFYLATPITVPLTARSNSFLHGNLKVDFQWLESVKLSKSFRNNDKPGIKSFLFAFLIFLRKSFLHKTKRG
jgi:hypothetical protein